MTNALWYAMRSKPHKENHVHVILRRQNIETFYPTIKVKPVNPRSAKIRPYFPGYLFVNVDLEKVGINTLQWMPGAVGLVHFHDQITPIPEYLIEQLRQHILTIQECGGLYLDGLQKGDRIRITSGPFKGYEGIFDMHL